MKRVPTLCPVGGETLVGTVHMPPRGREAPTARIGALLLNAGPAPRAGNADVSAHLADRLAERGMIVGRFDLPGLGDSTGASWPSIEAYWAAAQQGCNDEAVTTLVQFLCKRFGLDGLIVGGLCAGAICSVRGADAGGGRFAGLLLLEPNFRTTADVRLVPTEVGAVPKVVAARRFGHRLARLFDLDELLMILTGESKLARPFAPLRPVLVRLLERRSGRALPADVLLAAVHAWRRTLERGAPSIVITADGLGSGRYLSRILPMFPEFARRHIEHIVVSETNHLLTGGESCRIVIHAVEEWVETHFPESMWRDAVTGSARFAESARPG